MSGRRKPRVAIWQQAIRDDRDLDRTARLVAHTIATYMDAHGLAWPSVETIAAGCGLGKGRRSVQHAVRRLEAAGYLKLERSRGGKRSTHSFLAVMPVTAHALRRSEWETAQETTRNRASDDLNRAARAQEDVKTSKRTPSGASSSTTPECSVCGQRSHATTNCPYAEAAPEAAT